MTNLIINQSTANESVFYNVAISTDETVIRFTRNEDDSKGTPVLALSMNEAIALAKAILSQSYDAHIDAIAPDPDWRHMAGTVD